jgi:phenylalanyl-tRNA synthetase alpha chain
LRNTSLLRRNNITEGIQSKVGRNLHLIPGHPLNIIKNRIEYYFKARAKEAEEKAKSAAPSPTATSPEVHAFTLIDNVSPIVTAQANFDDLLVPADHPGRSVSDTFYYSREKLLRTHTSAHQRQFLTSGLTNFLVLGDCYRRDEIDASHYPVFHQMEGVRVFSHDVAQYDRSERGTQLVVDDLKFTLDGLVRYLFGSEIQVRWIDAYFPFTHPSFEMEIFFQGKWLEVFGCGVIQPAILDSCSPPLQRGQTNGWAFGLGLERLAMVLFEIPDIRLFWSTDPRFLDQFTKIREDLTASHGKFKSVQFVPFSKYPACFKDVAFWVPQEEQAEKKKEGGEQPGVTMKVVEGKNQPVKSDKVAAAAAASPSGAPAASPSSSTASFHENDFCSLVREIAGDLVENVTLIDSFTHPKTKLTSKCYRIMYRALNRNLTNEEIDVLQEQVRDQIGSRLGLKLR